MKICCDRLLICEMNISMDDCNYFCFSKSVMCTSRIMQERWNVSFTFPCIGPAIQDLDLIGGAVLQYCE